MDTKTFNWKKHLDEALGSTNFCCTATADEKGVWSNPVYFAWDAQYNLYFISQMTSRHMKNIEKNSQVSVSIYKTEQNESVIGIQLEGTAGILSEKDGEMEIKHAYNTYYGRAGNGPDVEEYLNNPTWLYVKITPVHLYYFDTRFFGEERQLVPLSDIGVLAKA